MQAFNLIELHDCWEMLKARGRVPTDAIPLAVQDALKELGLAEAVSYTHLTLPTNREV